MEDVTLAARADQEIDLTLPLHPNGDAGRYYAVNKSHLPQGLDARIEGDVVRLTGTLPAGQYSFGIGLEEAPGNACANWAGYHVDLAVTASP